MMPLLFPGSTKIPPAATRLGVVAVAVLAGCAAALAEPYPFEGSWVRADRICSPAAPSLRTYTAREVTSPLGHCAFRKVVFGSGEWELFQECRKAEHPGNVVEKIRMVGPDMMIVKHQVNRLKIPRGRRFARCMPGPSKPTPPPLKPATPPVPGVKP